MHPVSPVYEYVEDAEGHRDKLLKRGQYREKNLQVIKAPYPVDPRKPPGRRKK
jgi:hypothetical protein